MDVTASAWDCTLEPQPAAAPATGSSPAPAPRFAVRMGLRYVKGLSERHGLELAAQARRAPFRDLEDLVRRTALDRGELKALARAGALEGLGLSRREALWEIERLVRARRVRLPLQTAEPLPALPALDPFATVLWDRTASAHSPRGHPLEALRPQLEAQGAARGTRRAGAARPEPRPLRRSGHLPPAPGHRQGGWSS
ncbi:MAG: hypothetical protein KatS3mg102_2702 [Planctomycetota bacterium]|nr:MAG: hypothetical protein KatS3mg102_2702 [Planctomycetota bacterium]